jgi:hypothetical protein
MGMGTGSDRSQVNTPLLTLVSHQTKDPMKALRTIALAGASITLAVPALAHINDLQKITASNGAAGDQFGTATAIDILTSVVGAPGNGAGAAYVYAQIPLVEEAYLTPPGGAFGDGFGSSVSVAGDTVLVGSPRQDDNGLSAGAAYVYTRSGTTWSFEAMLLAADGAAGDRFGADVDLSGNTAIVGAPGHDGVAAEAGSAYVFVRGGTVWTQQAKLTGLDASTNDESGGSVALDGNVAVFGAEGDSDVLPGAGSAYVFERSGTAWAQELKLTDSTPGDGDRFGADVDIKGTRIAVGAPKCDDHVPDGGAVFVYDNVAGTWTLNTQLITIFVTVPFAEAGSSVAVDNNVLGGAPLDLATKGQVYFWSAPQAFKEDIMAAQGAVPGDQFGNAVSISDCWAVTGAHLDDEFGVDAGAAYLHALKHPQELYCTAGTSAIGCTPRIGAKGFASATKASGFDLFALELPGSADGLFFIGTNGRQANPWGSGTSYQCVVPPVWRGGLQRGSGTSGACDNDVWQDWNALWCPSCPKPAKNPGAGTVVQAQFWYRDPFNTSNLTTSLTNAIEFEMCP